MKIWVTGSHGMLGSCLMEYCRRMGIHAVGTGRGEADICNFKDMKQTALELSPTHVIHCAAYTDVDGAEKNSQEAFAVNVEGAANVATVASEVKARLIHISTDYVFDGLSNQPYREEDPCGPVNVYGKSKREAELRVLSIFPQTCIVRTSWLFGRKGKNFISSLLQWFQNKEEMQVVFDQCGKPTYCYDLAAALIKLLNYEGIIHFANEGGGSRYQIAVDLLKIADELGIAVKCKRIVPVPSAQFASHAIRPAFSVLNTDKYFHVTGTKPRLWSEAAIEYLHELR